jgi:DNA-binding response OmpR family regulator
MTRQAEREETRRTSTSVAPRILLAEDDREMREMLAGVLRADGYEVTECRHGGELRDLLGPSPHVEGAEGFDLVVSDIRMPILSGLEVLEGLFPSHEAPPVLLITAFGDEETLEQADLLGVAATLSKPFAMEELRDRVRDLLSSGKRHGPQIQGDREPCC